MSGLRGQRGQEWLAVRVSFGAVTAALQAARGPALSPVWPEAQAPEGRGWVLLDGMPVAWHTQDTW